MAGGLASSLSQGVAARGAGAGARGWGRAPGEWGAALSGLFLDNAEITRHSPGLHYLFIFIST
jgi:hypothetical protein